MKASGLPFLALSLALVGCASRTTPKPADTAPGAVAAAVAQADIPVLKQLAGTQWIVIKLGGEAVAPLVQGWAAQSLEFDRDGRRATGHGGVNRFGGRFEQDGAKLSFGPLAMTRRLGPPEQMALETRYTEMLSSVVGWKQEGLHVVLINVSGQRAALLERVAPTVKF